ncbi:MAG: DUF445 domain-containing protein [Acidimicrobiia bacterium]|nr:DUF445 domain-containing protein [Acidimicrobiia bacterium]MDH4307228.1 DUF445 domain-containing protein [Acidimicrobiia bacterium]
MTRDPLSRARFAATAVLAFATVVFASTFLMGDATWVGFLRAAAEAGMIGGLADWFAVTALFRHPLGIPIPHTAIIPKSKDALGRNLAGFITDNFLEPATVRERLAAAELPMRLGHWLAGDAGSAAAAAHVATILGAVAEGTTSDGVWADLEHVMLDLPRRLPIPELAGRTLERAVEGGELEPLVTAALTGIDRALSDNADYLRRRISDESPWWVPEALDDAVFTKATEIAHRFFSEVAADTSHPVRSIVNSRIELVARRLQTDADLQRRVMDKVASITERDEFRAWVRSGWESAMASLGEQTTGIAQTLKSLGRRLQEDQSLQARMTNWIDGMAEPLAGAARAELQTLIPATVARWDPEDTAGRLEQWMGRDLQFVRINGTVVGALIGLVLHAIVLAFE